MATGDRGGGLTRFGPSAGMRSGSYVNTENHFMMPPRKTKTEEQEFDGVTIGFESTLWAAADKNPAPSLLYAICCYPIC